MSSRITATSTCPEVDLAGGAPGQQGERRTQPLAAGVDRIGDIALDGGIERARLLPNTLLHAVEVRIDQLERLLEGHRGIDTADQIAELCEIFHK